jgi:hypothetical protein
MQGFIDREFGCQKPKCTIRDGRWLRTRQEWVEQYVAAKTIKPSDPEVFEVPRPRGKRHINAGIKLKKGGMGYQFLRE